MAKQTNQPTPHLRYSALTIVAFYGVITSLLAISAVFEAMTWEAVQEWLVKFGLVALILFILSAFIGLIVNFGSKR